MTNRADTSGDTERIDDALAEYMMRLDGGEDVDLEAFIQEHPYAAQALCDYFEDCHKVREVLAETSHAPTEPLHSLPDKHPEKLGDYILGEKIGQGGMGTVYRARHERLGKTVAVRLLDQHRVRHPNAVSRFEREMKAVAALDHPNIVRAHDAREVDGTYFLVMEYIDGVDLGEIVRRRGALRIPDACEMTRQAALALQCAHENGQVHRDIKPSNLMLDRSGKLKLLDLGLACAQWQTEGDPNVSSPGQIIGTADFISPEQISNSHAADIRSDIYSLGCTLFTLLAGRPPFSGPEYPTAVEKLYAHAHHAIPPVKELCPAVPDVLDEILGRMVAKLPDDRYPIPRRVAEAVAPFCGEANLSALVTSSDAEPVLAAATSPSDTPSRANRRTLFAGVAASILLIVVVSMVATYWPKTQSPHVAEQAAATSGTVWVRRGQDDDNIEAWSWDARESSERPSLEPLLPNDLFKIKLHLTHPTYWYLLWFDTNGLTEISDHAKQPAAVLDFPLAADVMQTVCKKDPPGLHLLAVVGSEEPPATTLPKLRSSLDGLGAPTGDAMRLRAGGPQTRIGIELDESYISKVQNRLPDGVYRVFELYLPTEP